MMKKKTGPHRGPAAPPLLLPLPPPLPLPLPRPRLFLVGENRIAALPLGLANLTDAVQEINMERNPLADLPASDESDDRKQDTIRDATLVLCCVFCFVGFVGLCGLCGLWRDASVPAQWSTTSSFL